MNPFRASLGLPIATLALLAAAPFPSTPAQATGAYSSDLNDSSLRQQAVYNLTRYPVPLGPDRFAGTYISKVEATRQGVSVTTSVYNKIPGGAMLTQDKARLFFRYSNGSIETKPCAGYLEGTENGAEFSVPIPLED